MKKIHHIIQFISETTYFKYYMKEIYFLTINKSVLKYHILFKVQTSEYKKLIKLSIFNKKKR